MVDIRLEGLIDLNTATFEYLCELLNSHDALVKLLDCEVDLLVLLCFSELLESSSFSFGGLFFLTSSLDGPDLAFISTAVTLGFIDLTLPGCESCSKPVVTVNQDCGLVQVAHTSHSTGNHLAEG